MIKKGFLLGALLGLIFPFVGVSIGLQVSPALANVLLFPLLVWSQLLNIPIGMWSLPMQLFGLVLSVGCWGVIGAAAAKVLSAQ